MYQPTWQTYEKDIRSDDAQTAIKATDAFIEERQKEISTSKKAKEWEHSRKSEIAENKKQFVKDYLEREKESIPDIRKRVLSGGSVDAYLKPNRGYILIKIVRETGRQTDSGLYIPDSEDLQNIADVLAVGEELPVSAHKTLYPPVTEGERVLIKKFAGMDIDVKGVGCKLILFSDVLATLEE